MRMKKVLSGTTLKYIAMVTMLIDHTAVALLPMNHPAYMPLRIIGRIAFPVYCFLLTEGFRHTGNVWKYASRLAAFAIVSEIPFDMVVLGSFWDMGQQNVFFTLFFGLLAMIYYDRYTREGKPLFTVLALLLPMIGAYALATDYGPDGVMLILIFYLFRDKPVLSFGLSALLLVAMGPVEAFAVFALVLIFLYNGQKGSTRLNRYVFYGFYPVHLLILGLLGMSGSYLR